MGMLQQLIKHTHSYLNVIGFTNSFKFIGCVVWIATVSMIELLLNVFQDYIRLSVLLCLTSDQVGLRAELKHINKRRTRK